MASTDRWLLSITINHLLGPEMIDHLTTSDWITQFSTSPINLLSSDTFSSLQDDDFQVFQKMIRIDMVINWDALELLMNDLKTHYGRSDISYTITAIAFSGTLSEQFPANNSNNNFK